MMKNLLLLIIMFLYVIPSNAQDLIAKQAPIDSRLKMIEEVKIKALKSIESNHLVSDKFYDWNNDNVSNIHGMIKKNTMIDLRDFSMPILERNRIVTSNYGYRWKRLHAGIDIKAYRGDTIRAAFDGKVRVKKQERHGYGNYILIRHTNGLETVYAHLDRFLVKENQVVKAGDAIGLAGNTGRSTGTHLHFEVRIMGSPINPRKVFDFEKKDVVSDYYLVDKNYSK